MMSATDEQVKSKKRGRSRGQQVLKAMLDDDGAAAEEGAAVEGPKRLGESELSRFNKEMEKAQPSQEGVRDLRSWIMAHPKLSMAIAAEIERGSSKASKSGKHAQKFVILHLLNDVLIKVSGMVKENKELRFDYREEWKALFKHVMLELTDPRLECEKLSNASAKILSSWKTKTFLPIEQIEDIEKAIKARDIQSAFDAKKMPGGLKKTTGVSPVSSKKGVSFSLSASQEEHHSSPIKRPPTPPPRRSSVDLDQVQESKSADGKRPDSGPRPRGSDAMGNGKMSVDGASDDHNRNKNNTARGGAGGRDHTDYRDQRDRRDLRDGPGPRREFRDDYRDGADLREREYRDDYRDGADHREREYRDDLRRRDRDYPREGMRSSESPMRYYSRYEDDRRAAPLRDDRQAGIRGSPARGDYRDARNDPYNHDRCRDSPPRQRR